ncbi:hypothetical protein PENTCL1PPCAC_18545, partial [Pristionchus entomophagus]
CPYPFLEARLGIPLLISSDVLEYECDFTVTATNAGSVLELTSIYDSLPSQYQPIVIEIYDGFTHYRLRRIDQSNFEKNLTYNLGTSKV